MATFSTNSRNNAAPAQTNLTTTYKTMVEIWAVTATLNRHQTFEIEIGADGAPNATDCQIVYDISRETVQGTGGVTAVAVALNPADPISRALGGINRTSEGTITAVSCLLNIALNQRASQRWIAAPGKELIFPATNVAGGAYRALSPTYAAPVLYSVYYDDL